MIAQTKDQAREEIALMFKKGQKRLVLSEFLSGAEYSLFVAVGRKDYRILPMAQDHKRAFDFDKGLNTGGMGAYSPLPQLPETDYQRMLHEVVEPTIAGLRQEEFDYCGILYIGLIMTEQGPKVIEYNVRLGDPETQVVLPRITSDFAQLIDCALNGDALPAIEVTAKSLLRCSREVPLAILVSISKGKFCPDCKQQMRSRSIMLMSVKDQSSLWGMVVVYCVF